jgi:myo-inositol-1(or 4)-monophosphatase
MPPRKRKAGGGGRKRKVPSSGWGAARVRKKTSRQAPGQVIALTDARRRAATERRLARQSPRDQDEPRKANGNTIDFHLAACIMCARAGGRVLIDYWGKRGRFAVEEKGRNDYVTVVDREAEAAILRLVRSRFPDHAVIAEESPAIEGTVDFRWYIDPLDGTTNYIHGYPLFAVSVGIADGEGMRAAAIYDPIREEMFTAARGRGAMMNGKPIGVSPTKRLAQGLIVTGIPFRSLDRLEQYLASFRAVLEGSAGIRRDGSAALNLAYVACGRFDGFWEMGLSSWDVAAGSLIVQEAGGVVTDFIGRAGYIDGGDIIAASPEIHPALLKLVIEAYRKG